MAHLRKVADYWSRLARQQGYPARSVFKLKEIDHRHRIFAPGQRVVDLGCSPGSWTMLAAERVGERGSVLGLDLQPLPLTVPLPPTVSILRQDVFEWKVPPALHGTFDVVLSDMAPSTTGIKLLDANSSHELCDQALTLAQTLLKPNAGTLVMKVFVGGGYSQLMARVKSTFASTATLKPVATRGESVETFIIAKTLKTKAKAKPHASASASAPTTTQQTPSTAPHPTASTSSAGSGKPK